MKCLHVQPPSGIFLHPIPLSGSVRTFCPPVGAWPSSLRPSTCTHSWVFREPCARELGLRNLRLATLQEWQLHGHYNHIMALSRSGSSVR